MSDRLSRPIESLIKEKSPEQVFARVDVAIVGSGYGGSIAAACLAGPGRDVVILERGREYAPGEFPVELGQVPGHVRFHRADADDAIGYPDALFDLRIGKTMDVLVGSGLGGTSLINANVAARPEHAELSDTAWPHEIRTNPGVLDDWLEKAEDLLGVRPMDGPMPAKHQALSALARALDTDCKRAPVAVTLAEWQAQPHCSKCGNCVTGCNVGAKNTLMMNALPLAHARGAKLYTGATVLSIMPSKEHGWIIRLRRTATEKTPLQDEVFHLGARDVILAAGTLGSTEILLRSRQLHRLKLSGTLGKNFSGNGDAIAFGFGQDKPVRAIGHLVQPGKHNIGPTITGIVRPTVRYPDGSWKKITIEDAAIPTSLGTLFGELLTTTAFLHRFDNPALPAWYRARSVVDPLTVPREAIDHTQALLIMGDDGAAGRLELRPADRKSLDRARIVVSWDDVGQNPALRAAHELLAKRDRGPGFDGGQYVPNPLWRVFPEQAGSVMSGPLPGGRAITVHPLGGCGMGDDVRTGVVNHLGQVFADVENGTGNEVYDGLYVLDGAIVPKALGVNPLLTIAALSWRAADALGRRRGWILLHDCPPNLVQLTLPNVPRAPEEAPERVPIHLVFGEQLIGTVTAVPAWLEQIDRRTTRWKDDKGLILGVTLEFPDLEHWLDAGTMPPVDATAKLYVNALPAADTRRLHRVHTPSEDLNAGTLVAEGTGTVVLFQPVKSGFFTRLWRAAYALWTYTRRRESFVSWVRRTLRRNDDRTPKVGLLRQARGFGRLAWQFAEYRRLQYRLQFQAPGGSFTLEGEKLLAWRMNAHRLWDALLTLPFTLAPTSGGDPVSGTLEVDMTHFVKDGTPQVKTSPHLPATIVALSRLGMLFARAVLQTHFWEFGAPNYPERPIPRPAGSPSLKVSGGHVEPEMSDLWVSLHKGADGIRLQLTRYRQRDPAAVPVLLIHGLAQGSLIYSTPTLEPNMAAALWDAGYDVWLLDYRLSNLLPEPVPQGGWSMDDIARYDIPTAVEHVYNACGERPVRIFAHCVGATSVAMAILKGWLKVPGTDRHRVECVAFNAIHPWTIPSPVNEFRARLGSFFRDVVGEDMLDPIPRPEPSAAEVLMDRLAFSLARYAEEGPDHRKLPGSGADATTVCDRMTLLYGRMWGHANLDARTHAALPTLVGRGAGDVYRQLYYFALQERLTDAEGENAYLTEENIQTNWKRIPTFFLHGEESMVFNPASAERSAIRLHAILNKDAAAQETPVRLLRVPGFGHMDVVFGKDAHAKVYPKLREFFDHPRAPVQVEDALRPEHDIDPRRDFRLTAGPVLRAAWLSDEGLRLRLWVETTDEPTSLIDGVEVLEGLEGAVRHKKSWTIHDDEARYRLIDTQPHEKHPLQVKPKLGPMVAQVAKRLPREPATDEPMARYELTSLATVPWLHRLRNASTRRLCRDMRFLVGSCRYPGTPFDSDASDAVFGGMLPHIAGVDAGAPGVHMLFLVGDQIYADATANILDSRAGRERYGEKYRLAFTSKNASTVLAQVPTHFAIDDHEIADNWSGEEQDSRDFELAKEAAQAFQSSGRGQSPLDPPEKWQYEHLWYALSPSREQCCPTFVMDTRSGRKPRFHRNGRTAQFVDPKQLDSLLNWLAVMSRGEWAAMPKFIVCGVGIAPISRAFASCGPTWRSQDWWHGYPEALSQVVSTIVDEGIQHVVFVSGDLHLSSASRLTLRKKDGKRPAVTAWQVVSSGLYAPMPFANSRPDSYDWNTCVRLPADAEADYTVDVEAESGLLFAGESHFLRVDAEQTERGWTLSIGAVGANGGFLQPIGQPPRGFVAAEPRWTAQL